MTARETLPGVADTYCERCGFARFDANLPDRHRCQSKKRRSFVDERAEICATCPANMRGVCAVMKERHPDRPGVISEGVKQFATECPKRYWLAVRKSCECGQINRDFAGVTACVSCGANLGTRQKWQQPAIDHLIAVTSLSASSYHAPRQSKCLESWSSLGLKIVVVNSAAEIETMADAYQIVDHWHSVETNSPTQKIADLAAVAVHRESSILLINSDIEIYGPQATLLDRLGDGKLVAGIRHNYHGSIMHASRERYGIDAFVLTPSMAASLPQLSLSIGRPVWDYWLPLHFLKAGYEMEFIGDPFFYHASHQKFWSRKDWTANANEVNDHYGRNALDLPAAVGFRCSLPYSP